MVSAVSIFIALLGVSINALITRPFVGIAYYADENNLPIRKEKWGKYANWMIVAGTLGQFVVVILTLFF